MWRSFLYQAFRNVAETTAKINKQIANESFASEEERNRRIDELWREYGASGDGGVVTSAMPSKKNPKVLDPRTVTENDVREMLEMAQYGVLDDDTYIPMRSSTPQFFY